MIFPIIREVIEKEVEKITNYLNNNDQQYLEDIYLVQISTLRRIISLLDILESENRLTLEEFIKELRLFEKKLTFEVEFAPDTDLSITTLARCEAVQLILRSLKEVRKELENTCNL